MHFARRLNVAILIGGVIFILFVIQPKGTAQTNKPFANYDVLQMVKDRFSESIIIKAIDANETHFDVSVQALMDLKSGGVGQPVIKEMLAVETKKKGLDSAAKTAKDPLTNQSGPDANIIVTTNAPKPVGVTGQCLIVAMQGKATGVISGREDALITAKGKWEYRDSYNLSSDNVKTKYSEKDITTLIKRGIHVIVVGAGSQEVTDARIACQGQVPQK